MAYMAKYPEIQKKIHEELDKVVNKERLPNFSDNKELKYFNTVLCEVQRITNPATETFFHTVTEDFECEGYFFERNTQILLNIYNIHHNPKYWKDPDSFNPERFTDWDPTNPHFIPFSTGPRGCAGTRIANATVFYYLTFLLQRYDIVPPEKFEIPHWNFTAFCECPDFKVSLKLR